MHEQFRIGRLTKIIDSSNQAKSGALKECTESDGLNSDWIVHGQLQINFEVKAIRLPGGNIITVKQRHLEALVAIPPDKSFSLEEVADRINEQRATIQAFLKESYNLPRYDHYVFGRVMTVPALKTTYSELKKLTDIPIIQHESVEGYYGLAHQYR
jgi:hypothetical protein